MQYILDCPPDGKGDTTCTIVPYHQPPATVDHYLLASTWTIFWAFVVLLVAIVATGMVRYKAWGERRGIRADELNTQVSLAKEHKVCPTCGDKYDPAPVH